MRKDDADATLAAYRYHAREVIRNWKRHPGPSKFLKRFAARMKPGQAVLDYGCGIGTDLAWFVRWGLRAEGVDGTFDFVQEARKRNPTVRVIHGRFEVVSLGVGRYDGVWCNAALIHVPPPVLRKELKKLAAALRPGGILGITLAWGRVRGEIPRDWIPGRYLCGFTKGEAARLFRGWAVERIAVVSGDGRAGRWIQLLARTTRRSRG